MQEAPSATAVTAAAPPTDDALKSFAAPAGVAFFAGAAIMIVEIVASRLAAQYLGASLYTWTSAIGSVLVGLTLGNYVGGRLADGGHPRRMLAGVLLCASMACLALPSWNVTLRDWEFLWTLGVPARTALHMLAAFVLPTLILAMIGPLVARIAIDQGRGRGRAVGSLSAWNAAGCITGTFLAGFVLVAWIGAARTLCLVSVAAATCGMLLARDWWIGHLCFFASAGALGVSLLAAPAAQTVAQIIGLRPLPASNVLAIDESTYSYISVERDPRNNVNVLRMDQLVHSQGRPEDPTYLGYDYERIYSAVTERSKPSGRGPRGLVIGGGGFSYPRYFLSRWPGSTMDVAEIDPAVTRAAATYFGLDLKEPRLHVADVDGRAFLRDVLRRKQAGEPVRAYDFIYGDAVNDYSVPHHLTTVEYDRMVQELLAPDGLYLINLIDGFETGRFLGAVVNTFRQVFPHVYVFCTLPEQLEKRGNRDTFVVVGAKVPLDTSNLSLDYGHDRSRPLTPIADALIERLIDRSGRVTLSDDYAPVQYMLADVVRKSQRDVGAFVDRGIQYLNDADPAHPEGYLRAETYFRRALAMGDPDSRPKILLAVSLIRTQRAAAAAELLSQLTAAEPTNADAWSTLALAYRHLGQMDAGIEAYQRALRLTPDAPDVLSNLGDTFVSRGQYDKALPCYLTALRSRSEDAQAWYNVGLCLNKTNKPDEAEKHFARANQLNPQLAPVYFEMGMNRMARGKLDEAAGFYEEALKRSANDGDTHFELAVALTRLGRRDDAIGHYRDALRLNANRADAHFNLANLLASPNTADEARSAYRTAITLRPAYAEAFVNLGLLEQALGRTPDAVHVLNQGLRACANDPSIGLSLAWILSTSADEHARDGSRALQLARQASDAAKPKPPLRVLIVLAAAQAQAGQFDDAVRSAEQAHVLAVEQKNTAMAEEISRCRQRYQARQTYAPPAGNAASRP